MELTPRVEYGEIFYYVLISREETPVFYDEDPTDELRRNLVLKSNVRDWLLKNCGSQIKWQTASNYVSETTGGYSRTNYSNGTVYYRSPGEWGVHIMHEHSRLGNGERSIYFRTKSEADQFLLTWATYARLAI